MTSAVPANVLPSRKLRLTALYFASVAVAMCLLFWFLDLSPSSFQVDPHFIGDLFHQFFPPKMSLFWTKPALWMSLLDTLSMAFLATVCGEADRHLLAVGRVRADQTLDDRVFPQLRPSKAMLQKQKSGPAAHPSTLTIHRPGLAGPHNSRDAKKRKDSLRQGNSMKAFSNLPRPPECHPIAPAATSPTLAADPAGMLPLSPS